MNWAVRDVKVSELSQKGMFNWFQFYTYHEWFYFRLLLLEHQRLYGYLSYLVLNTVVHSGYLPLW